MTVRTVDALLPKYPNLAKFAEYLYSQVQNPTVKVEQRKEAELVLKDLRLLAQEARLLDVRKVS